MLISNIWVMHLIYSFIHVCLCVCMCLCVCVRLFKSDTFRHPALIATKLHTHTKDLPGKVLQPMPISYTYRNGRCLQLPLLFAQLPSTTVWPSTNFLHHCDCKHKSQLHKTQQLRNRYRQHTRRIRVTCSHQAMHVHSCGLSTTYTPLHVATMLFTDPDCCTRMYVYTVYPHHTHHSA